MSHRLIDVHTHCFPEDYLRDFARTYPDEVQIVPATRSKPLFAIWSAAPLPAWDVGRRLQEMNRHQVEVEVLSAPTVYHRMDEHTAAFCAQLNDFQAAVVREHPTRFRSFIHLPVHDLSAARKELDRWIGRPEVVGINLATHMGEMYPGDPRMSPVWEWAHDQRWPVFVHPVKPCGLEAPIPPVVMSFPHDTAMAAASLIYSGVFDRLPGIQIILSHYGGALPVLAKRLDIVQHPHFPSPPFRLGSKPSSYVQSFYVDTAQGFHRPGFDAARAVFGIEHMLYGSDHFFHESPWREQLNRFFEELPLCEEERFAVLRANAQRVLGIS